MEKQIIERLDKIISVGDQAIANPSQLSYVNTGFFVQYRAAALSFLISVYGKESTYYIEFENILTDHYISTTKAAQGILQWVRQEILSGGLIDIKKLVTADLFADFLEMAQYLLGEGYKDASAVMIGSVLEEHLRKLCDANQISIISSDGRSRKADSMNGDLAVKAVYGKLDLKNVTAWLDLRNKAAHGQYSEYTSAQVENLLRGVSEFISRTSH